MMPEPLTLSRFERAVSSTFTIDALAADGALLCSVEARLDSVSAQADTPGYEQFAVLFIGPPEPLLPQGTYRFRHADMGELALFLVPVARDANGCRYEVCVTRNLA